MVITFDSSRRPCDSEALATSSYEMNFAHPLSDDTFVRAAVRVVLPWSMCPIVPTFTCGLLRSNFSLAMSLDPRSSCVVVRELQPRGALPSHLWSRCPESNWRPRPYQGRALPTELHRPAFANRSLRSQLRRGRPASYRPCQTDLPSRRSARALAAREGGWSGRRGSNPRPTAWKAVTLPLSYSRLR